MFSNQSPSDFFSRSFFETLEERVLFDAVPDATFILPEVDAAEPIPPQVQSVHQADVSGPKELILVDGGVQDAERLMDEVLANRPESAFEVRMINADQNGIQQISEILAGSEGKYDAIHIISHGNEGEVLLGNSRLTADNFGRYANELALWSEALTDDADLLFYGCELAGSADGQALIQSISEITGADVAASDDITGNEAKQGDWNLEIHIGAVATQSLSAENWQGILMDTDGDGVDDINDLDSDNDGISDVEEGSFLTTVTLDQVSALPPSAFISGGGVIPDGSPGLRLTDASSGYALDLYQGPNTSAGVPFTFNTTTGRIQSSGANVLGGPAGTGEIVEIVYTTQNSTNPYTLSSFQINDIDSLTAPIAAGSVRDAYAFSESGTWTTEGAPNPTAAVISVNPAAPDGVGNFVQTDPDGNNVIGNVGQFDQVLAIDGTISDVLTNMRGTANDHNVIFNFATPQQEASLFAFNSGGSNMFWGFFPQLDITVDNLEGIDTDMDGVADHLDLDSDNDGISDLVESGAAASVVAADANNDGTVSVAEGGGDADGDGLMDVFDANTADPTQAASIGTLPIDSDLDGTRDWRDLDSDNDGIADTIEARPTVGYVANDGDVTNNDADGDGIIDLFDSNDGSTALFGGDHANLNAPNDHDMDGTPDYLDVDTDNDGVLDSAESGLSNPSDATYMDPDGSVNTTSPDMMNQTGDLTEVAFREGPDKDGDGVADEDDLDDDNDGIIDTEEGWTPMGGSRDTDGDGIPDHCDLDSDNDGISDLYESGDAAGIALDLNGDGTLDLTEAVDSDGDGLMDVFEDGVLSNNTGTTPLNSDTDGLPDYLDLDSDDDGIADTIEARPTAGYVANDGDVTNNDADGDGVIDIFDSNDGTTGDFGGTHPNFNAPYDHDGDGIPDYLDEDSDNDNKLDSAEGAATNPTYMDPDGSVNTTSPDLPNETGDLSEVGFREVDATIGVAKEVVGVPVQQADGNFLVTYAIAVENTSTVDLAGLSVIEDLATEFGAAFVSANNLRFDTPPTDPNSDIFLNGLTWNGNGNNEMIDNSGAGTILQSGDSFIMLFDVIVDPSNSALDNQVVASGSAVDESGNPITDGSGNPVTATDSSDSGTDPAGSNPGEDGDTGGSDDATPLYLPDIGLAKSAGDAVANGDNFDVTFTLYWENTGNVTLNNAEIYDDIAAQFGAQYVGVSGLQVQNFMGTGTAPVANTAGWNNMNGTTSNMINGTVGPLNPGDSFEVVFTVTIDPDATGTASPGLENSATSNGDAYDENGNPITDDMGNPVTADDTSDNGTDPTGENGGDENGDGSFANDPTPIIIADIGVAKQIVGSPVPVGDNFEVTYQLVVENTGTVDLADISLVDDLATQFGGAFVSAGSLTMVTPPSNIDSNIVLDSANWNGGTVTEMVNQSASNLLKVGDLFIVQITVEVDPDASGTSGPLNNQATAGGDAVDESGNPYTDSSGNPIMASDDSDSGADPNGDNGSGGSDDPTPLVLPALAVAKQANTVTIATDGSGTELTGVFDVQYLVVLENTGTIPLNNLQLTDDITLLTNFGDAYDPVFIGTGTADRSGLVIGPAIVSHTIANAPADLPNINGGFLGGGGQAGVFDGSSGILQVGEQVVVSYTVRIDSLELTNGQPTDALMPGNQVTGSADSPSGTVTDDSDDGLNPNTDNGEGGTDDPTPFEVPQIRLWKSHSAAVSNGDGTSTITVTLRVQNSGTVDLNNLTLSEDIAAQFGQGYISASLPTLDTTLAPTSNLPPGLLNPAWAGDTSLDMFNPSVGSEILTAGEEFSVIFDVVVDPDQLDDDSEYMMNNASVTGDGQTYDGSTITVDDESGVDDGSGLDSDEPTDAVVPEIAVAKAAGDAVANGDNWDVTFTLVVENTGSVNLDTLTLFDDIDAQFGNAYVSVAGLAVQNFAGAGTAPTANAAWEADTALNMLSGGALDPGDRFEVVYTVTIDPDGIDSISQGLVNDATAGGNAVDQMGNPLTDATGNQLMAEDDSDSGTNPQGTNPGGEGDNGTDSDPTPIIIADVAAAKQVVGTPAPLPNGNYEVTYEVTVENIGTVDLANLSLEEDLATQFGAAYVDAYGLTMVTPPGNPSSNIPFDSTNWNGGSNTEMINGALPSLLAVGDAFVFQFMVEVDVAAAIGALDNTVAVGGTGVDDSGTPYEDASGNPITASDNSDSGTDPSDDNSGAPGDMGTSDDPTPLYIPVLGLAKEAGDAVANGDNFDVTFTFLVENNGTVDITNLSLTDDVAAQFGNAFVGVVAGSLDVVNFTGSGIAPDQNSAWEANTTQDLLDGTGQLNIGDSFEVVFTVTIDPDGIDSVSQALENQGTVSGDGINPDTGLPDPDLSASDDSNNGSDADATGDDPTPIIIADIAAAKQVVGTPTQLANGNFEATYQVVIENIGTVDLADLTLDENLMSQFGAAYVDAYGLLLTTPPSDPSSAVSLDSANWDGGASTEIVNTAIPSLLAVGDSFIIEFKVEIDPTAVTGVLNNTVVAGGTAVDENGDPIQDSSGNDISTTDDSDSGSDPSSDNPGAPGDDGTSDSPTPLIIPTADLVTVKTLASSDSTPAEGDIVTFEIAVTNDGPDTATGVSVTDLLPAGLTATASNGTVTAGTYDAATGLWSIGNLASGATVTLTLEGTVDVGEGGNTITNITTAASGQQFDPSTDGDDLEESVIVENDADLVTAKTLISGDSTPAEGDSVTFQISVTNNGAAQATGVSLTDQLPAGLTFTGSSVTQGVYNATTGLWTVGTLNDGETAIITLTGTVDVGQGGNTITNITTAATGDQDDPTTDGDDLEESIVVDANADLVTTKTLASENATPLEGDVVTFLIEVTNNGSAQATNVSLTDLLPAGLTATAGNGAITQGTYDATTGLYNIGTLNVGETATLTIEGTVDVGQGGNTITNITTAAEGDQPDPTTDGDDLEESVVVDANADLVTTKVLASGNPVPLEGDVVTFEIHVTNNGTAQATNVSLTDLLPTGLTATAGNGAVTQGTYDAVTGLFNVGTLNIGETATLTIEGTVNVGEGGNTITNITTAATGDQPDPTTGGDDLEESVEVDANADLVTTKTLASGNSTPLEGDVVTFVIEVTNNGTAQASNVSLTDLLPAGLTATAGNGAVSQGTYDPVTGLFNVGTLNIGETATLTIEGTVDVGQGGNTITNITTPATGDQPDPTTDGDDLDESVEVDANADLVTEKTLLSADSTPAEGDSVTFLITVTNNGTAQATGISLTDQFPAGITFTGSAVSQGSYNSTTGLWTVGTLNNAAVATIELTGTVDVGRGGETITNVASAATGDQPDPTTAGDDLEEAIEVENLADLVTSKTLISGDATPAEGDSVTFQISVTNNGAAQATGVSLTDQLPAGLTFTSSSVTQGAYNATTGLWTAGTLNVGEVAVITLTGTVDVGQGGNTITNITTAATGDQDDPTTAGDDLEESIVVDANADLVTTKTLVGGNATPLEGDVVTFQIEVTNNGTAQATNVSLTDLLPAGLTATANNGAITQGTYDAVTGLYNIGTLNVGETATLTIEGTVDVGQGGNTITNITTAAAGDQPDPTTDGDDLEESVVVDANADLVTTKVLASGNPVPLEGDVVTFEIHVTNNGTAQATNVSLTDLLPAGLTATAGNGAVTQGTYDPVTGLFNVGTLNIGETATLTIEGTVDVGEGGNTITNITTAATGDQPDPTTDGDDLEESVEVDANADLVTTKTLASGSSTPLEGDVVTFVIEVTNNGTAQATNVSLTDLLPAGLTATAGNGAVSQGTYDPVTGLFNVGTLNIGDTATLTIEGTVDVGQGGNTITNITTPATGDQPDPTTDGDDLDESVEVDANADLVTEKTLLSADSTPAEGDSVTFLITVTNNGTAQATGVSLTDQLPAGLTFTGSAVSQGSYNSTTGLWTVGTLNNGATATIEVTGTVDVGEGGNTITNVASAATGDQPDPTTAGDDLEEAIEVENLADLVTEKTLISGNPTPAEGDSITFQISVTNNGAAQATGVSLTDQLPAGLTFTSSSVTQGAYNATSGLWTAGTLNVGEVAVITLTGTVDVGQGGNTITNITTAATGDQDDPTNAGDDLDESIVVDANADLVTTKTLVSGNATPLEGDVVTFLIEVTNNGSAQATNVSLTDLLPAGLTATAGNGAITQGTYDAVTGLYNIGTLNVGETATLTIEGTVDVGQGGNTITNITTAAEGDQPDPTTDGDDLEESVVVDANADLVTTKVLASGNPVPLEGDVVTFEIHVTNNGTAQATNVSLTDLLPAGLTATAGNGAVTQGTYDPVTGLFNVGTLNIGETATLTIEGTVDVGEGGNTITNITTAATGDQPDPTTDGDDLEESVVVDANADLVTTKTLASGSSTPLEGDVVTFVIEVTNNGTAQATNVSLNDLLPAGLTATAGNGAVSQGTYDPVTGLFNVGTLNIGETATLTIEGTVDVGQGGNTITNITTPATGDQPDPTTDGDDLDESVEVDANADLVTEKTLLSADSTPAEGDSVTFLITITNNGTAQATGISLTDQFPTGITFTGSAVSQGSYNSTTGLWTVGTLNNVAVATIELTGTVDVGRGGETITNVASAATGDQPDPTTAGDDLEEAIEVENLADLVTEKSLVSGDSTPAEGDSITFQIAVTNNGSAQATGVSLTDQLPAGITFTSSSVTQGTYNAVTGLWNIGTINEGDDAIITLTGTVDVGQGGNTLTNITTAATGDQDDPTNDGDDLDESIVVDANADLVTTKTLVSGNATPLEGDVVTFLIEVTNNGSAQATNVSLTDLLPAGLTATAGNGAITQGTYDAATGLYNIGTLNVGETATLTIEGTVDVGQGGNTITNITTAAAGDQPDPTTDGDDLEESVVVDANADLVTTKVLASGNPAPLEGDVVTFEIHVTNNGTAQATNVSLTDLLPAGLTATANNGAVTQGTYDATTGLFNVGTLNIGETATLTIEGTVDVGEGGNTITNITTAATGDQPDPTTGGDDLEESVEVDANADLVTTKTLASGSSSPLEGDVVTFVIEVTNNGTAQATNVSLTDLLPAGLAATAGNGAVSQGTYDPVTGLFNVGTLNIGDTATLTIEGTVDVGQGGNTITNITTPATGDQPDPTTDGDDLDESVEVDANADLVTEKTLLSADSTPAEGDSITFLITVTNNGAAQATGVSLTDQFPAGLTFTGSAVSQGSYNSTTGLWTIGTLGNGGTATIELTGTVDVGEGGNTVTNVASAATGDQPDPTTAGDDLEESVEVENLADLVTEKSLVSGNSTPAEGDSVTFQISVTNNGAAQATGVSLTDQLPAGLTFTSSSVTQGTYNAVTGLWNIGTINEGDDAIITLTGTIDVGQGGNTITNITTAATGDQDDPTTDGDDLEESFEVDANADLVTTKTLVSGNATPLEGDVVTFQIEVTNNGTAQATNVSLTDLLPTGLTATANNGAITQGIYDATTGLYNIGTLNVGETATLTIEGTVDVGQGGNTITNITTAAAGDQPDPTTDGDDLDESVVIDANADLVTVKVLASANPVPLEGDVVTFEIHVTNNGTAQATNVSLTDLLPAGLTATAGNGAVTQGTYDPVTGLFSVGTLNIGETATLTIEGTVDVGEGGNTITNITTAATGDQPDPTTGGDDLEESVEVDANADLVTTKTLASGSSSPLEGDVVTFVIEVTNNGTAQATNVSLTDLLPAGLTATAGNGAVSQGTYDVATGLFNVGTLNIGETATLTIEGTVDVGQGGNTITNITTPATGDQPDPTTDGDDLDESVVVDANADLVTEKTLLSADSTPAEGDSVTFLITVTNNGAAQATGVSLTDQLPAGLTFTGIAVSQGSYNSATGLWTIGTLGNGAVATIELTGTVDVGEGGNTVTNVASAATGDQPDPTTAGDDLEEAIEVENLADLVTEKSLISGNPTPAEGDLITFQITVTNNGAAQATGVSLVDQMPAGVTLTNSSASQGTYNAATGLWNIGTINEGEDAIITLTGTVDAGQAGNTITNITTAATGDQVDPTTAGDDLEESVSPLVVAELGIAKSVVGEPVLTATGNHIVTYQVVVANTGNVALANLSLLEDLATQFGGAFVSASGLTITSPTSGANSLIAIDTSFDGDGMTELMDISAANLLEVGDSFTLEFDVEIDSSQISAAGVDNTISGSGTAVDSNGDPLGSENGSPISATDNSDSGSDPSGTNVGEPGDTFGSDDPTPLHIPSIGLAKQAGDAVANGENWDVTFTLAYENNGTVDLSNLTLFDDVNTQFGDQLVAVNAPTIQNFSGTGTAPTANGAWAGNTTLSMITGGTANVGDSFEVVFTVTLDPDASGTGETTVNEATGGGEAVDSNGDPITNASGAPLVATDQSDNGSSTVGENGEDNGDGVFANDPTPVVIADLGIAKTVVGTPEFVDGNFLVTYEFVVANTGTVDLADLSLIEDLATQFGAPFVDAGDLILFSGPSNPGSSISLNSAGFNGNTDTQMIDQSASNLLQTGDSFVMRLTVEVDPTDVEAGDLDNQVVGSAAAVDENGNPLLSASGETLSANDFSDSGSDTQSNNPGFNGNTGGFDDPTPLDLPPQGAAGNPPNLPGLPPLSGTPIGNLISGFAGSPGTIYSGIPINANANPLSLDSGRAVSGGYSGDGSIVSDCGCPEPINPCCEPIEAMPCEETIVDQPVEMIMDPALLEADSVIVEDDACCEEAMSVEEAVCEPCEEFDPCATIIHPAHECVGKPGFLKRFANWLRD